ncbi:hypothetical protein AB0N62_44495 [Streptomyces sp. NPDC093982]|uniref:hypothetical protein n=1 Tax=Streptomyces sp. NPDC093982 TaxID=3155077 RepID=UPI00343F6CB1
MTGRHKKARKELSGPQARALQGGVLAASLSTAVLAGAANASADVNKWPYAHASVSKGTGPGTNHAPVITWGYADSVDPSTQKVIGKAVENWDQALRRQTGTTTPWFENVSKGQKPAILFQVVSHSGSPRGFTVGDPCDVTRDECSQRVDLSGFADKEASEQLKTGLVAHEIGHALGLAHATGGKESIPGLSDEVMRPTIAWQGAPVTPSANETATVAKIYGQSSQRSTTPIAPTRKSQLKENEPVTHKSQHKPEQPSPQDGWQGSWHRNSQGQWTGHWQRDGWQGDWTLVDGKWQGQWTPTDKGHVTAGTGTATGDTGATGQHQAQAATGSAAQRANWGQGQNSSLPAGNEQVGTQLTDPAPVTNTSNCPAKTNHTQQAAIPANQGQSQADSWGQSQQMSQFQPQEAPAYNTNGGDMGGGGSW